MVKNLPANAGDTGGAGSISKVRKIPWRRKWQPIPVFLLRKSHGQRCLAGYSPWNHRVGHGRATNATTLLCPNRRFCDRFPEKAMAPHSSTLAWKIPWTEELGRLQSMGSLRIGHD